MTDTTVSMTAILELRGTDTNKAALLIAKLVANQRITQNATIYEYYKDGLNYYLYERYAHSDDWAAHFEDFGNFADEFLSVFNLVQPKGFGPVSDNLKNALLPMGFQFYETIGSI
tara:strand:+ start:104 stop:448 length:345 start_codon:yes stop_codon:yes gene_type:complete